MRAVLLALLIAPLVCAQEKDAATLPMDLSTGRPIVQVFINGDGPFKFVFDTAASQTIVSSDLSLRLRLPSTGVAIVSTPGSLATVEAPKKNIKELRCGDFKFFDRSAVVISDKAMFQVIGANGVLSLQDFDGYIVTVDYRAKRLLIEKGALPEEDDPDTVPLEYVGGVPGIKVIANDSRVFCVLDTGSPFSIALPTDSNSSSSGRRRGIAASLTDRFPFFETNYEGVITIARISLTNPVVQMLRGMPYGNLGRGFFSDCVVSFDIHSSKVKIVRNTNPSQK